MKMGCDKGSKRGGTYRQHRRKKNRQRQEMLFDQRRSIRDTNVYRISEGRPKKGGGRRPGEETGEEPEELSEEQDGLREEPEELSEEQDGLREEQEELSEQHDGLREEPEELSEEQEELSEAQDGMDDGEPGENA